MPFGIGCLAFLLFFLYDWNQLAGNRPFLRPLFACGCLCLGGSTLWLFLMRQRAWAVPGPVEIVLCLLCAVMGLLTLYALFFALPFEATYLQGGAPQTYTQGVYALCRHPGVLFLAGFYAFLWLATGDRTLGAAFAVYSLLNLLYALFQDRVTFPRQFCDYEEYRRTVPFLIPNRASLRRCLSLYGR